MIYWLINWFPMRYNSIEFNSNCYYSPRRTDTFSPTSRPLTTAIKVHKNCARRVPSATAYMFSLAASTTTLNWDLSPNSATNIIRNVEMRNDDDWPEQQASGLTVVWSAPVAVGAWWSIELISYVKLRLRFILMSCHSIQLTLLPVAVAPFAW